MELELFKAVTEKNSDKVSDLLADGNFDLNWQNPANHDRTALHLSCLLGIFDITVIHLLRAPKVIHNVCDSFGKSPFFLAVEEAARVKSTDTDSRFKIVKEMLEDPNIDLNLQDAIGINPILVAASWGNFPMVKWMVASGRHLDVSFDSATRLGAKFIRQVKSEEIVALLTLYTQNPQAAVSQARSELQLTGLGYELWMAVALGKTEVVRELLSKYPPQPDSPLNVNWTEGEFKRTPLYRACSRGFVEIVQLFLKDGRANVNHRISVGSSPLYIACQTGHAAIVQMLLNDPRVSVNLEEEESKCTPLYVACANRHVDVVKTMIAHHRVDINKPNREGSTPLFLTSNSGFTEIVTLLLNHKDIDVNRQQNSGYSPFAAACWWNRVEVVKLLLQDPRVNIHAALAEGWTGLFVACFQGSSDVLRVLLKSPRIVVNKKVHCAADNYVRATCHQKQLKALEILLEDGRFDPNEPRDNESNTPLANIVSQNHLDVLTVLLASTHLVNCEKQINVARSHGNHEMADLLEEYQTNPERVRSRLRMKSGVSAAEIFALVVFYSDDFLVFRSLGGGSAEQEEKRAKQLRFFSIARRLPIELQMILCNRHCGLGKNLISYEAREKAFRQIVSLFAL